jgi:hypothetical protein
MYFSKNSSMFPYHFRWEQSCCSFWNSFYWCIVGYADVNENYSPWLYLANCRQDLYYIHNICLYLHIFTSEIRCSVSNKLTAQSVCLNLPLVYRSLPLQLCLLASPALTAYRLACLVLVAFYLRVLPYQYSYLSLPACVDMPYCLDLLSFIAVLVCQPKYAWPSTSTCNVNSGCLALSACLALPASLSVPDCLLLTFCLRLLTLPA